MKFPIRLSLAAIIVELSVNASCKRTAGSNASSGRAAAIRQSLLEALDTGAERDSAIASSRDRSLNRASASKASSRRVYLDQRTSGECRVALAA